MIIKKLTFNKNIHGIFVYLLLQQSICKYFSPGGNFEKQKSPDKYIKALYYIMKNVYAKPREYSVSNNSNTRSAEISV